MPLPTLAKQWRFTVNQVVATTGDAQNDHRQLLRAIKDTLKGFTGGWTHVASSDKNNTSTTTDLWTGDGALVWDQAGTAHSWLVLQQTGLGTNAQLLIDLNSAQDYSRVVISLSPSAGFNVSSPSTLNAPTATDQVTLITNGEFWLHSGVGTTFTARLHAWQSNDGQCTRLVAFISNIAALFWIFDRASGAPGAWNPPVFAGISRANPSVGVMRYNDWWSSASWLAGRTPGGAISAYLSCEGLADKGLGQMILVANELDGGWPFLPIGVVSTTAGSRGRLGSAYDLWFGSTAIGQGDTYPNDTSKQFVQCGHFILPWDGTSVPQTA